MTAPVIVPNLDPEVVALVGGDGRPYTVPIIGWAGADPIAVNGPTDGGDFVAAVLDLRTFEFTFVTECPDCQAHARGIIDEFLSPEELAAQYDEQVAAGTVTFFDGPLPEIGSAV